ncbi:MAG: hemerythrin domain-containing protein [Phycisphaerae bacterium]
MAPCNTCSRSAKGKGPDLASRPKGVLDQDHRQIELRLEVLALVLDCLPPRGTLTPSQGYAITEALDYFAREATWHTRDEEQSLFPRLRAAGDHRLDSALGRLATLEEEHVVVLALHDQLDAVARAGLRTGKFTTPQRSTLRRLLEKLQDAYRRHMEIEDREVFPLASTVLGLKQMKKIDQEIAQRRRSKNAE